MKHYIGLDVSMKETSICIVNEVNEVIYEGREKSEPAALSKHIKELKLCIEKIAIESGSLSHYLVSEMQKLEMPVICICSRQMAKVLSVKINKTDRNDARGIAEAIRCGYYKEISLKSQKNIERKTILGSRRLLVEQRTSVKNGIRGFLKTYGVLIPLTGKKNFIEKVKEVTDTYPKYVRASIDCLLVSFETLSIEIEKLDKVLRELASKDEDVKLLTTVPGVGIITAMAFIAGIDDPTRFKHSRQIGAYVGLTPKQYSSGETHRQGGVSKCGNPATRALLVEAATVMLTRTKVWCKPKAWACKLARKKGTKKAAVALARKLSVIMHRMLITREKFRFGDNIKEEKEKEKVAA